MGMHEPWKASAPEVYHLRTTDGSVPRGLDPNSSYWTMPTKPVALAPSDGLSNV